jgi:hypothetical protein
MIRVRLSTLLTLLALVAVGACGAGGCALVPQNRRAALADPLMQFDEDSLEAHKKSKFYSTREGAAGGDGTPAGGGCGCQ